MNYETAKKLKDAGFPATNPNGFQYDSFSTPHHNSTLGESIYVPTLSELIEACGEDFRWLKHNHRESEHRFMAQGRPHWKDEDGNGMKEPKCFGATPEEAVALLYLALNERV